MIKKQDVSNLLQSIRQEKTVIQYNERMYPVKGKLEENWLYYSFASFKLLDTLLKDKGMKVTSLALIGTGNGVDAIGAHHIFKDTRDIYLTDIDDKTLPLAIQNIKDNQRHNSKVAIQVFTGDVCEPLEIRKIKVDLIYANLPNIPLWEDDQTSGFGLSTFYTPHAKTKPDPIIKKSLLELQSHFLHSAKKCLNQGGSVVQLVGGRFPTRNFELLFEQADFELAQLCAGLKPQTEATEVLQGYARAEKENHTEFIFYDYNKALEALRKVGETNLIVGKPMDYLENTLKDYSMTATQALKNYKNGTVIGHTCHALRGTVKNHSTKS